MHCVRSSLLSFAVLAAGLSAQHAPQLPVEDLLPASSYASIRFAGLANAAHAADHLAAADLVRDLLKNLPVGMVEGQIDAHLDAAAAQLGEHLRQVDISPSALRALLSRPMALGVGRLTIDGMGPSVALLVDCREGREEVHAMAKAVQRLLRQHAPGLKIDKVDVAGAPLYHVAFAAPETPQFYAGDLGDCYVLSNSVGYLGEIAAVMAGKQPSLAQSSMLGGARGRLGAPALLSLFVNTGPVLAMVGPHLPYEMAALGDALGVSNLDGLFAGAAVGHGGGAEVLQLGLSGNPHGALKAAFSGAANFDAAKWCGGDAVAFATGSLDVPAAIAAFHKLFDALPLRAGEQAKRDLGRDLSRGLRQLGMTPAELEQLLAAFGRHVSLAVDLASGQLPLPQPLLFVEVADRDKVAGLLDRLKEAGSQRLGLEWRTRESGDDVIHFCDVQPDDSIRLTPCYAFADGMLVVGAHLQSLQKALEQRRQAETSLFAQPDFATAMQHADGVSGFMHLRWFRAAELTWRTVETQLGAMIDAHADEIGFGSEVLPELETVKQALGTCTTTVRVDGHGVTLENRDKFGFSCMLAGALRAADEVLARACGRVF